MRPTQYTMIWKVIQGGAVSYGRGIICSKSSKQKINTKSSTEAELVGICDFLQYPLWFLLFLKYQGYTLDKNIVFQDNQSAIRLEKNGRNSCTGKSRHIDIKYFFVKDRIDNGDVSISYCPSLNMLADFYTKATQGSLFKKFRDVIMGYVDISVLSNTSLSSFEERVGNKVKKPNIEIDGNEKKWANIIFWIFAYR